MAFAIIQTGGKQYRVSEGSVIHIEKLPETASGDTASFDVLLLDDGTTTKIGTPKLAAKAEGTVEKEGKNEKVTVIKYKAKSRYFKKRGHRQPYMAVKITKLG